MGQCRRSLGQWQEIIDGHGGSGTSVGAYCRRNGINDSSFYRWRRRMNGKPTRGSKNFITITASDAREVKQTIQVKTPRGYVIEVQCGTDGDFLRKILTILKESA